MFSNNASVDPTDAAYKSPNLEIANDIFDVLNRIVGESESRRGVITDFIMNNSLGSIMLVDSDAELVREKHCIYVRCTNDRSHYHHKANCIQAGHMIWYIYHSNNLIQSSQCK